MTYSHAIENLNQDIINKLQVAIEIGRWENGDKLTEKQLETSMQAVMFWQAKNVDNKDSEPFVVGPKGELYTGKGESHKIQASPKYQNANLIVKKKV